MKAFALITLTVASFAAMPAFSTGEHAGGHGGYSFGEPGKAAEVSRTIKVRTLDAMKFEFDPAVGTIKKGETIRFIVSNPGQIAHEFAIGDAASQRAHALMMQKMPGMKHDADPSTVSLAAGETKTLIWKFDKAASGGIVLACHIPGHYEAGMQAKAALK
ncbi:copper oxidase [Jeongeupia sp. HS-3]|uniref:cupredoxin domain-containing protein n=1 Tax=Jeongeupia sp. HS-3 TaxID=1009682 RepID=UPI0018A3A853|nr:plastocyanin/azurin family copper-binding protein [Jeongeupia sp. HS-3]BCL74592.1 copper oxidase [Jeongeupia sp. HS-3]